MSNNRVQLLAAAAVVLMVTAWIVVRTSDPTAPSHVAAQPPTPLQVDCHCQFACSCLAPEVEATSAPQCPECPEQRECSSNSTSSRPSFDQIARSFRPITDKVDGHHYQRAYDRLLPVFLERGKRVRVLEIGLGCNMGYGPGASVPVWLEYFKSVGIELSVFEYDAACATAYARTHPDIQIYTGDQAREEDLAKLIAGPNGVGNNQFDIIVEDGGHTWVQQQVSFRYLFPKALAPGGMYFLEDLLTSYMPGYAGGGQVNTVDYIKTLLDDLDTQLGKPRHPEAVGLRAIMCFEEICVFEKN